MYRQYILGEDKYVELEVICRQPDATVVIPEATWELWRVSQDTPESSGSCEVDRQYIRALVEPQERAQYRLVITYAIPPETRKAEVMLNVT